MKHRLAIRQGATPKRLLTAAEAAVSHRRGDRYVKSDGTMVRLHIPKATNAPQAHFEIEPRWMS